jgi:hypothetical protein
MFSTKIYEAQVLKGYVEDNMAFKTNANAVMDSLVRQAITVPYFLSQEEYKTLCEMFDGQFVFQSARGCVRSTHPIYATLNDECNKHASSSSQSIVHKGGITMSIGDSTKAKVAATSHNCIFPNSMRDRYRQICNNIATRDPSLAGLVSNCRGDPGTTLICTCGAQNCKFQADAAFAVHSLYDVSFDDVVRIFESHNLKEITVYMYFPPSLFGKEFVNLDVFGSNVSRCKHDPSKLFFNCGDFSLGYIHDKKQWEDWARITKIVYNDSKHAIMRETLQVHGPLHIFKLVKVLNVKDEIIPLHHPFSEVYKEFVMVPSIRAAEINRFVVPMDDLKHYVVPRDIVVKLLAYANRQADESFKYTEFLSLASAYISPIRIGGVQVTKGWQLEPSDFTDLTVSLFVIAAIQRANRTKAIGKAFGELKASSKDGFFDNFIYEFNRIGRIISTFIDNLDNDDCYKDGKTRTRTQYLKEFNVIEYKDENTYLTYHSCVIPSFGFTVLKSTTGVKPVPSKLMPVVPSTSDEEAEEEISKLLGGHLTSTPTIDPAFAEHLVTTHIKPSAPSPTMSDASIENGDDSVESNTSQSVSDIWQEPKRFIMGISSDLSDYSDIIHDKDDRVCNITPYVQLPSRYASCKESYPEICLYDIASTAQDPNVVLIVPVNSQLTDGAGFAKAFNEIFDYHNYINSNDLEFLRVHRYLKLNHMYRGIKKLSYLVIPPNYNTKNQYERHSIIPQHPFIRQIFRSIRESLTEYSCNNPEINIKLRVPAIGCGNFGNRVKCLYRDLRIVSGFDTMLIVHNESELRSYTFLCKFKCSCKLVEAFDFFSPLPAGCSNDTAIDFAMNHLIFDSVTLSRHERDHRKIEALRNTLVDDANDLAHMYIGFNALNLSDTRTTVTEICQCTDVNMCRYCANTTENSFREAEAKEIMRQAQLENDDANTINANNKVEPSKRYPMRAEIIDVIDPYPLETVIISDAKAPKIVTRLIKPLFDTNESNGGTDLITLNNKFHALSNNCDTSDDEPEKAGKRSIFKSLSKRFSSMSKSANSSQSVTENCNGSTMASKQSSAKNCSEEPRMGITLKNVKTGTISERQLAFERIEANTINSTGFLSVIAAKSIKRPNRFKGGHCAIASVYHAAHIEYEIRDYFDIAINAMCAYIEGLSLKTLRDYIENGNWVAFPAEFIFVSLAARFDLRITVHVLDTNEWVVGHGDKDIHVYYADNHYSHIPPGGARDKYPHLIQLLTKGKTCVGQTIADVSAAPGFLINDLLIQTHADIHAFHYTPGLKMTNPVNDPRVSLFEYDNYFTDVVPTGRKYDYVICDIGRLVNTEEIVAKNVPALIHHTKTGGSLLIKTFGNCPDVWKQCVDNFGVVTPYYKSDNVREFLGRHVLPEVYLVCENKYQKPFDNKQRFNKLRIALNKEITNHALAFDKNEYEAYRSDFIKDYTAYCKETNRTPSVSVLNIPTFDGTEPECYGVMACTGLAGASKSTTMIKAANQSRLRYLVIAPTNELADALRKKGAKSVATIHTAFDTMFNPDIIMVDEATTFAVPYITMLRKKFPLAMILLMGDVHQIPYVNLSNKTPYTGVSSILKYNNMYISHTIPQDMMNILNKAYRTAYETTSIIKRSIFKGEGKPEELHELCVKNNKPFRLITYLHNTMVQQSTSLPSSTITTAQGSRFEFVALYVDSKAVLDGLHNRPEYIYTALTRHSVALVTYGTTQTLEKFLNINGAEFMKHTDLNRMYFRNDTIMDDTPQLHKLALSSAKTITNETVTANVAISVLHNATRQQNESVVVKNLDNINYGKVDHNLSTNTNSLNADTTPKKAYMFDPTLNPLKAQTTTSHETIRGLIGRYGEDFGKKMSKKIRLTKDKITVNHMLASLVKAIYGDQKHLDKFTTDMKCDDDFLMKHAREYLESASQKAAHNPSYVDELNGDFEWFREKLTYQNKNQFKFSLDHLSKEKVGQGIAAFSKRVNFLFSVYARALLARVSELLVGKRDKPVIVATHGSDEDIAKSYSDIMKHAKKSGKRWFCCDYSQWDSTFTSFMGDFTWTLMRMMGADENLTDYFRAYRKTWVLQYFSKHGAAKLSGKDKQFSGNPFTICENTLANLCFTLILFDFKDVELTLVKGDDLAILCSDYKLTEYGKEMLTQTGHQTKIHFDPVGEFAGFVLTELGFYPDTLRYATKFIGKQYTSQQQFDEAQKSAFACTQVVHTQQEIELGAVAHSMLYRGTSAPITPEESKLLFNFLKTASTHKYSSLKETTLHHVYWDNTTKNATI